MRAPAAPWALRLGTSVLMLALVGVLASGCASRSSPVDSHPVPPLAEPTAPMLDTPESAVESYLDWISFAYSVADSEVASPTMTPEELVRVDSYIQYNVEQQRRIDQS